MSITVVVDEGSAQSKITYEENNQLITKIIPTRLCDRSLFNLSSYSSSSYLTEEGLEFTVNPDVDDPIITNIESFQTGAANRAIVHESLRQCGFGDQEVDVITTLPVGSFFSKGSQPINQLLIEKKKNNLMAGIENRAGEKLAKIKSIKVYPEAIPALFELSRHDNGELKSGFTNSMKVMIIDIGGTTTDVSVITPNGDFDHSQSIPFGVFNIAEELKTNMLQHFNERHIPPHIVDKVLREKIMLGQDVSNMIHLSSQKTLDRISTEIEKSAVNPSMLDKVLIVGGGASLIGQALANHLNVSALIPEQPDVCISRGIFKIEKLKSL